jgi:hypothetical protein
MARDGRLLGRLPHLEGAVGQSKADTPLFQAVSRASSNKGPIEIEGLDGVPRIYAVADVDYGSLRLWLMAGVARSAIVNNIDADLDIQEPPSCDLLLDWFEVYLDDFLRRVKSHQDEAKAQIR